MRAATDSLPPIRWADTRSMRSKPLLNYTLEKGQSATFLYRIVFYTYAATAEELNAEADAFAEARATR